MRKLLATLSILALVSCGGNTTAPPTVPVTGGWSGETATSLITMALTETGGIVTGEGCIWSTEVGHHGGCLSLSVSGSRSSADAVNLTVSERDGPIFNFAGRVTATEMTGTANGYFYPSTPISFRRP